MRGNPRHQKGLKNYWELLGIGLWDVRHFSQGKLSSFIVDGKPVTEDFDYICAVTWVGSIEFELIEPVKGPNIYYRFLETKGEGLHHFKYVIPNNEELTKFVKYMESEGYKVMQAGWIDNDVHYYMDTEKDMGMILELGNGGKIGAPDYVYPSDAKRPENLRIPNYKQVCVLVEDVNKSMKWYCDVLGFGPWDVRHFTPKTLSYLKVDGKDITEDYDFICACTWVGNMEMELVQPIKGPVVYWDQFRKKGESIHHIKDVMSNKEMEDYITYLESKGCKLLQTGRIHDDIHAYMDTSADLHMILELGNGEDCGAPDYVYPPQK